MAITVYGIPNCDTVKKARAWLDARGTAYEFHDFRKAGVPADRLDRWCQAVGWQKLVNRQGTTWRRLDPSAQAAAGDEDGARQLMQAQPSIIKRPVVEWPGSVTVGFDPKGWEALAAGR
jgi:Spx/MgsR family transcriptional regulator